MLRPLITAIVVLAAGVITLAGEDPVVETMVVAGFAVVVPLALGGWRPWAAAALAAAVGMRLDPSWSAAVAALPAVAAAVWAIARRLDDLGVRDARAALQVPRSLEASATVLAPVWAGVASAALLASLAGLELFGIGEPIVRLTAVHYLYAGVGALTIAERVRAQRGSSDQLGTVAVAATAVAPPVVAVGFVLEHPVPQIGGAALMTAGVWATAYLLLTGASRAPGRRRRMLRVVAGLAPWVPMVLALFWATAQHVADTPALSIPDMARLHGLTNGLGFVVVGLVATGRLSSLAPAPFRRRARA